MERVLVSPAVTIASGGRIYSCVHPGCGLSYTSPAKLLEHCVEAHNLVISQSPLTAGEKNTSPLTLS